MADLLNQYADDLTSYKGLLNLNTLGSGLTGVLQAVTDGMGVASPLQLSTASVMAGNIVFTNSSISRNIDTGAGLDLFGGTSTTKSVVGYITLQYGSIYWGAPIFGIADITEPLNRFTWVKGSTVLAELTSEAMFRVIQPTGAGIEVLRSVATGQKVVIGGNNGTVDAYIAGGGNSKPFQIANLGAQPIAFSANGLAAVVTNYQMILTTSGNLVIGADPTSIVSSARVTIKSSGNTGTTNAFLVQNVSGTNQLRIRDDGNSFFEGGGAVQAGGFIGLNYGLFGGLSYSANVVLGANSTVAGFLPPCMTTAQKTAIGSPVAGLIVYDTTLNKLCVYTTAWETITSA